MGRRSVDGGDGAPPAQPAAPTEATSWDDLKVRGSWADVLRADDADVQARITGNGVETMRESTTSLRARLVSRLRSRRAAPEAMADLWNEFRRELSRSRRYERQFVLVRIPCRVGADGWMNGRGRETSPCVDEMVQVSAFLRNVDRAWVAEGSVYVLLPESDRARGEAFLARIRRLAPDVLPEEGVRLVAFPEDGPTSGALLAALEGRPLAATPAEVAGPLGSTAGGVNLRARHADHGSA